MADRSLLPGTSSGHATSTSSSTQANNFVPVRCEFCELEFKCDLDVSRHLASEKHRKSLDQFLAVQNQVDKTIQKDIPKRLDQVFQAIKVRDVKDLKDLADKGFFEVYDESIAEIGQRLALSLFKAYVEYTSQDAPPRIASKFIETVAAAINDHDNDTTQSTAPMSQAFNTSSLSQAQTPTPSTSKQKSPQKAQQAPSVTKAPPQPNTNIMPSKQQVEKQKSAPTPKPKVTPKVVTADPQTKSKTKPTSTATTPQVYRPGPASVMAQRSGQTPQVTKANQAVTQPRSSTSANRSQTNQSGPVIINPLPGTIRVEAVPRPLEQSTYKVKLATIKMEPKE